LDVVAHAERDLFAAHDLFDHVRVIGVDALVIALGKPFVGGAVDDLAARRPRTLFALDRNVAFFRRELRGIALQVGMVIAAAAVAGPLALILPLLLTLLAVAAFHLRPRSAGFALAWAA